MRLPVYQHSEKKESRHTMLIWPNIRLAGADTSRNHFFYMLSAVIGNQYVCSSGRCQLTSNRKDCSTLCYLTPSKKAQIAVSLIALAQFGLATTGRYH